MPPVRRRSLPPVLPPAASLRSGAVASLEPGAPRAVAWLPLSSPRTPHARPYPPVRRQEVLDAWRLAHQRRAAWLQDLHRAPAAAPPLPKDLTATPRTFYMRAFSPEGRTYAEQAAAIGQREGFVVEADTCRTWEDAPAPALRGAHGRNLDDDLCFANFSEWTEDDGFVGRDGSFNLPARLDDTLCFDTLEIISVDRACRLRGLSSNFDQHGAVAERGAQLFKVSTALAAGRPVRENLSYVEGGNCLLGTRRDGTPYALVGRDSVAVTRALLKRQLERPVSQRTALEAIAKDLGLAPRQVHPVEQPGQFHLDMSMVAMAPGQVLLNDARLAAEVWEEHERLDHAASAPALGCQQYSLAVARWRSLGERLERRLARLRREALEEAAYEGRAHQDLRAAGLEVMRVPGRFPDHNFLNGEGGTNARGERFFITQGGEPWLQARIADLYLRRLPTGLRRLYFLDVDASRESLDNDGGLGCRVTAEAAVA